jgi:hypothetical protein
MALSVLERMGRFRPEVNQSSCYQVKTIQEHPCAQPDINGGGPCPQHLSESLSSKGSLSKIGKVV